MKVYDQEGPVLGYKTDIRPCSYRYNHFYWKWLKSNTKRNQFLGYKTNIGPCIYVIGIISCNGQDGGSGSGGASGGAIKLQTGTLSGSGKIQTNGGKGNWFTVRNFKVYSISSDLIIPQIFKQN